MSLPLSILSQFRYIYLVKSKAINWRKRVGGGGGGKEEAL